MLYRLRFLDAFNRIEAVEPFKCPANGRAMVVAERRAASRPVELWCGDQRILRKSVQDLPREFGEESH